MHSQCISDGNDGDVNNCGTNEAIKYNWKKLTKANGDMGICGSGNGRSLLNGIKSIKNYLIQNLAAIIGRIKKE